jgi:hypothetical protein
MTSSQGFQSQVYVQPAPAVEGDYASTNPRATVLAGPGNLVAGLNGVRIGRFAWVSNVDQDANSAPGYVTNLGGTGAGNVGSVAGFVHREQQGLITDYLVEAGMVIKPGFGVTLMSAGDFWVKNSGTTQAFVGNKAYANFADGSITFAATGLPTTGTASGSAGPQTASFTGALAGNILTVTAVANGTLVNGMTLTASGTATATGTQIAGQLSGTVGGVGIYAVNIGEQTIGSTTFTGSVGLLTVTGTGVTGLGIGVTLTGTGFNAATVITQLGTGTGGAGTYYINPAQTAGATTITFNQNVETKWVAQSEGLAGELVKISSWLLG